MDNLLANLPVTLFSPAKMFHIAYVAGKAAWGGIEALGRGVLDRQIRITHPRPLETLSDPEALGNGHCFRVTGTLKHLPTNHEIWLLTEDEVTGRVWPQGFFSVQFDSHQRTWTGKINGSGRKQVKITAVVAPPTARDFFRYYQRMGGLRDNKFEPLEGVPVECKNRASMQALIP